MYIFRPIVALGNVQGDLGKKSSHLGKLTIKTAKKLTHLKHENTCNYYIFHNSINSVLGINNSSSNIPNITRHTNVPFVVAYPRRVS